MTIDWVKASHLTSLRDILRSAFKGEASNGPDEWDQLLLHVAEKVYNAGWRPAPRSSVQNDQERKW